MTTATIMPCQRCISGQTFLADTTWRGEKLFNCLQCGAVHNNKGELEGRIYKTPTQGNFSRDFEGLKERQIRKNYGLKRRR